MSMEILNKILIKKKQKTLKSIKIRIGKFWVCAICIKNGKNARSEINKLRLKFNFC